MPNVPPLSCAPRPTSFEVAFENSPTFWCSLLFVPVHPSNCRRFEGAFLGKMGHLNFREASSLSVAKLCSKYTLGGQYPTADTIICTSCVRDSSMCGYSLVAMALKLSYCYVTILRFPAGINRYRSQLHLELYIVCWMNVQVLYELVIQKASIQSRLLKGCLIPKFIRCHGENIYINIYIFRYDQ